MQKILSFSPHQLYFSQDSGSMLMGALLVDMDYDFAELNYDLKSSNPSMHRSCMSFMTSD